MQKHVLHPHVVPVEGVEGVEFLLEGEATMGATKGRRQAQSSSDARSGSVRSACSICCALGRSDSSLCSMRPTRLVSEWEYLLLLAGGRVGICSQLHMLYMFLWLQYYVRIRLLYIGIHIIYWHIHFIYWHSYYLWILEYTFNGSVNADNTLRSCRILHYKE